MNAKNGCFLRRYKLRPVVGDLPLSPLHKTQQRRQRGWYAKKTGKINDRLNNKIVFEL